MNVNTVKYFLTVCQTGNFTKAAAACGIRQPTLSVAIKVLERDLGGLLFERDGHGVILTPLAHDLRPIFRAIARQADRALAKAHAARPGRASHLQNKVLSPQLPNRTTSF